MGLKDEFQSLAIVPLDGSGFNVQANHWVKDENGEYVLDEDGNQTIEQDVYGFTTFSDLAQWFGTLDT